MITLEKESKEQFLSGGGEMGKLIRSLDWSETALGPIEAWPQSLRTSVSLCLSSTFPILIAWGPETIQIYNDSYRPICGAKHPESMGMNFRICWETALPVVGDAFSRGEHGEGTYINDQRMFLDRYGYLEEAFMTFSFAPIRDESGGVGGIFHPITETTVKMLSARRTQILRDLGAAIGKAKTVQEIGNLTANKYNDYNLDVPFLIFYQIRDGKAQRISTAGLPENTLLTPSSINIDDDGGWPLHKPIASGEIELVTDLKERFGEFSCEPYEQPPHSAVILPIKLSGQEEAYGYMIAGVSVCRAVDQDYLNFYDQLANTYSTAVSNVYAYEQEQKRAEALAEIDRSKTAFFSNVSHEFRTPLTLMLGPLEDLLHNIDLTEDIKAPIESTHRNALRLLKLVNNLLDYSRVEAGRTQAAYELVDIAELTTDLASSFRSIIEKAGMELIVDCQPVHEPVFVDRQMWEKIVLNLLSNAFKYTLAGKISVSLSKKDQQVVLKVTDTGVGIPAKELPHMFERFHRIENTAGRTHEGTGIGLSLVHELVQLHHGDISVSSVINEGSTFTVHIPVGKAHLPAERVLQSAKNADSTALKGAFIQEAISLLQEGNTHKETENTSAHRNTITSQHIASSKDTTILIVDDNADMRAYLNRLLEPVFNTVTAINGLDALEKIARHDPALVLSDIMMPVMDGKTMLENIRQNAVTLKLPVIFLSARAGEEARIDGLEAGADDYLVKPFSAAELLTKIRAQIHISKIRGRAEQRLRELLTEAPVAIAIYRGPDHFIEIANERMLQYWGRTSEQTTGARLFDVIPELETQGFRGIMDGVYQTGQRFTLSETPVYLIRNGRQEMIYLNLTIESLREEDGSVNGMIVVASDITEQVQSKHELQRVSHTLKLAMDAAQLGTWRTIWGTDVLELSPRARTIHGIPADQPLSFQRTLEVIAAEHRDRFLQAILNAVETKGSFNENYLIQPFDGSKTKWINSTGKVELNPQGEVISVTGTILDITESKEDELRKNDFIAMVSHELKTPLTSLNGYSQLLKVHALNSGDQFAQDKLDKIGTQIRKMIVLINSFLNVSRLESGKIVLNKSSFNVNELIGEVIRETELDMAGYTVSFVPASSSMIEADRHKLSSVLSNLFSNAMKYSPKGTGITITAVNTKQNLTVSVTDEGMGIHPHEQEKLFDRYYRVQNHDTKFIGGFGIGLYLSAEIIKRHNGQIGVDSIYGKGSKFYFTIPIS